jgi:hypothetical protein
MRRRHVDFYVELAKNLQALRHDQDDLPLLEQLQRDVLRAVLRAERSSDRYRRVRSRLKRALTSRLSKDEARKAKEHVLACDSRIAELKSLIVIWKTIGDGIAHVYLDKYALKQTFYKTDSYEPKESAGFISGNAGHQGEWALLEDAIKAGVPAVLCDLTNTIRHGDVCLLAGGGNPFLIEVKSSDNQNKRTTSQSQNRQQIQDFLTADVARNFRGLPVTSRVAFQEDEINHVSAINDCMRSALATGACVLMPEAGLYYIALASPELPEDIFDGIPAGNDVHAFSLAEAKNRGTWDFFQPFAISFEPELSGAFLRGEIVVLVMVDMNVVRRMFAEQGARCTVRMDGTTSLYIEKVNGEGAGSYWLLSEAIFFRIPFEFQSLAWFVRVQSSLMVFPEDLSGTWTGTIPEYWSPPLSDNAED